MIRPLFARACPFPFGNWTPARLRRRHNEILDLIYPNRLADQWFEFRITELCEQCFHTLSTKLGDDTFFGGNQINADDALLFGYLAPMLYVTLPPGTRMVHALRQHPSLVALVERVRIHLYADLSSDMNGFKSSGLDSYELPDSVSWSELIFGAVIALSSMAAYAVWTGIVQFESDEDDVETESHSNAPSDNSSVESSDQKRPNPLFDLSQELLLPTPDSSDQQGDKSSRQERDSNEHQMPKLEEDTSSTN